MTNDQKAAALDRAMEARAKAKGDPITLAGLTAALKLAVEQCNDLDKRPTLGAQWAGVVTLDGKRVADVGVFVAVR